VQKCIIENGFVVPPLLIKKPNEEKQEKIENRVVNTGKSFFFFLFVQLLFYLYIFFVIRKTYRCEKCR
jgi:hypothetical protein